MTSAKPIPYYSSLLYCIDCDLHGTFSHFLHTYYHDKVFNLQTLSLWPSILFIHKLKKKKSINSLKLNEWEHCNIHSIDRISLLHLVAILNLIFAILKRTKISNLDILCLCTTTYRFCWIKHFPSTSRENMLISLIPRSLHYLTSMRLSHTYIKALDYIRHIFSKLNAVPRPFQ